MGDALTYPCTGCRVAARPDADSLVINLGEGAYLCQDCACLVADIFHEKTGGLSMALAGEVHDSLKLMVRYLEEETRDGDGIREEHFSGYIAAKSAIVRGNPYSGAFEKALTQSQETLVKASEVPGLSAALDEARFDLERAVKLLHMLDRGDGRHPDVAEFLDDFERRRVDGSEAPRA